jgi:type IV pilus assembly protein PilW
MTFDPCSHPPRPARQIAVRSHRHQAGLTLIEFMVSIAIGMLMIAALATLIASQSSTRAEIDKSGKMIENGRYAAQTLTNDVQMAGYWGELPTQPAAPASLSDPCSLVTTDLDAAMGLAVQGYDAPATLPTNLAVCVQNQMPGTDLLVVRRADPDMSAVQTAGAIDLAKVVPGQVYLQTGMDSTGTTLTDVVAVGSSSAATNATTFVLKKKDNVSVANLRKMVVHIYYISQCSVLNSSGTCTNADGGTPIPTLKRVELGVAGGVPTLTTATVAEGIENLQIDYGIDSDGDGAPDGSDIAAPTFAQWPDVVTLKVYLLARSADLTAGFSDSKTYGMGVAGSVSPASTALAYKRHLFVQSVRLVNPSSRREL